jgi:hypothetical protein
MSRIRFSLLLGCGAAVASLGYASGFALGGAAPRKGKPAESRWAIPALPRLFAGPAPKKARPPAAIAYRKVVAAGVPLHVVQMDPRSPELRVAVATAGNGLGYRDGWSAILDRTRPAAAITGTYFCTDSSLPIGSIVVGGRPVYRGAIGTAFTFTPGKGAKITTCRPNRRYDFPGAETVLRAGPRLLTGGKRTLSPQAEGFRDPAVYARKPRTAIGITRRGKLLLVAVQKPVLLRQLAAALKGLGAVDAMCLDGGGSTALYHDGKTRVKPGRPLTNLLVVYESRSRYDRYVSELNPVGANVAKAATGKPG